MDLCTSAESVNNLAVEYVASLTLCISTGDTLYGRNLEWKHLSCEMESCRDQKESESIRDVNEKSYGPEIVT